MREAATLVTVGLIVSIGVSVDSNVVYFEHLKEDVRGGRTVRSAVDRAFPVAYSTIVKADVATLIAAGVLWWLSVGLVKGFALFLGVWLGGRVYDMANSYTMIWIEAILLGVAAAILHLPISDQPVKIAVPSEPAA